MKIYFDIGEFPNTLKECDINYTFRDGCNLLHRDIEFIECDTNRIVLQDDIDREDFQDMLANWDLVIRYIMESIEEQLLRVGDDSCSDFLEVLEWAFEIEGLRCN